MKAIRVAAALVLGMSCSAAWAEVKLASVFTDHMVLQRGKPVVVWGTATAGKAVTVQFADEKETANADDSGKWMIRLKSLGASEAGRSLSASEEGANTVTLQDVLVGDVWVCSGQSNMEFGLPRASNAAEAIAGATDDKIRFLVVPHAVSDQPQAEQKGAWVDCTPESAKGFSAVGYFFGKEIRGREHVPVGLVGTYWGGTLCEAWTPPAFLKDPQWEPLFARDREQIAAYPKAKEQWEKSMKQWEAKPDGHHGRKPAEPRGPGSQHRPSVLWNAMVAPLTPMSIKGIIWYQGESNAARAEQYRTLFPNMIEGWRDEFKQGNVSFLFVQLANYGARMDSAAGSPWAELRQAQAKALKLPKTGMAVTIDIGNPANIHPTDKQTVGTRLALAAEHVAYGKSGVVYQGPTFESMEVLGNKAIITFDHADGLMAKGGEVKGFAIAGQDKKFVPATARIEGESVVVSAPDVEQPAAVRYAWAESPEANVYNHAGLPAVPFRTDDWSMATAGKK